MDICFLAYLPKIFQSLKLCNVKWENKVGSHMVLLLLYLQFLQAMN